MVGTRRFDHILPAHSMKPGTVYLAWKCKNEKCDQPIAPDEKKYTDADPDRQFDHTQFIVKCPHCHRDQERVWAGREGMTYAGVS
jgi:hypothetical protein